MGKVKLVGDVDKNGGAAWRDASVGNEQKEARQKLLHLDGGGKLRRAAEEFRGEVLGVIMSVLAGELGSGTQSEVTEAEAELGIRARKTTTLTVWEAMVATGRIAIGFDRDRQECETFRVCAHCFLGEGVTPHMKMHEYQSKGVTKKAFRKWLILKRVILVGLSLQGGNGGLEKEMREQAPALHT